MNLGQLYICGISGLELTSLEKDFLREEELGGVILFSKNYESPEQLAQLVNEINSCKKNSPLFISVDQEGGRVQRFKKPFTEIPPMLDIASLDSPKKIFEVHQIMAKELKKCGINLSFAPVCDVLVDKDNEVIGDRAFGKDSATVEKMISGALRGYKTENLLACAKHFPGHGDTSIDSHYDLPIVKTDLETLKNRELKVFYKAIRSKLQFMMISHVVSEALDSDYPASLSKKVIHYLREELKFQKLVVSDDMEMQAITDKYGIEESTTLAMNAGIDILVYRTMDKARESLEYLKSIYGNSTEITESLIREKLERINEVKAEFLSQSPPQLNTLKIAQEFPSLENRAYVEELLLEIK